MELPYRLQVKAVKYAVMYLEHDIEFCREYKQDNNINLILLEEEYELKKFKEWLESEDE